MRLSYEQGRRAWLAGAVVFVLAMTWWFFSASDSKGKTARLQADAWYYHAYLPSLLFDGDLDFENQYERTGNWYQLADTPSGRAGNVFGVGPALFEAPFFALGHGAEMLVGEADDGFGAVEVGFTLYGSLLASLGALFFTFRLLRRRLGSEGGAAGVALLVFFGGPVVYYAIRQPGYAHPFATLWVAWLLDHWDRSFDGHATPRSMRFWLGFGALLGAATLARPQLALWGFLGLWAAVDDLRSILSLTVDKARARRQSALRWAAGLGTSLLILSPQLLVWKLLYGSWFAAPQGEGFMRWGESMWLETLFSSRNGLIAWAPLYGLALLGLVLGLWRRPRLAGAALLGLLLQAYANGAAWDWWGGGSFGGRRFDSCYVALAVGLGCLLIGSPWSTAWRDRSKRIAAGLVAGYAFLLAVANTNLATQFSGPTVPILGGGPASEVLASSEGPLSKLAAISSSTMLLPLRLHFAWRYDTNLDGYSRVVGVHQLGELYPGLNAMPDMPIANLVLMPYADTNFGFELLPAGGVHAPTGKARLLFGLNRRDPVQLRFAVVGEDTLEHIELSLNGRGLECARRDEAPEECVADLGSYERGVNELLIAGPPGWRPRFVQLEAPAAMQAAVPPPASIPGAPD